jgi:hypothetical protein
VGKRYLPAEIQEAESKIKSMPSVDGEKNQVPVLWPRVEAPEIKDSEWSKAKLKRVKIKKLFATDNTLKRDDLSWHAANPGESKAGISHPRVVVQDGKKIIVNGHHRLAALMLLGQKKDLVWQLKI